MRRALSAGLACLLGATAACSLASGADPKDRDWPYFGNDSGAQRFSPMAEINRGTVKGLKVAWTYHTGDSDGERPLQCTPIVVDGSMYLTTVQADIVALDPANGEAKWRFYTGVDPKRSGHRMANRGVAYWSKGKQKRILLGTPDGRLVSIDAATGKLDPHYGPRGIEVRDFYKLDGTDGYLGFSAAPMVYKDLVFLGPATGENYGAVVGDIFAFHIPTGKLAWRFKVIPEKGEPGSETWENGGRGVSGGAGPWNGFTLDAKRGILYAATGSPTGDFYGGKRLGANLYGNCVLAIDARTGKHRWHFQTVHHDLWDWDNASQPLLCTVKRNGKDVDAVAQLTKRGWIFVLDRETGKPLFPVREVPVPASEIQGEKAWPTQPEPEKPGPYGLHFLTEGDLSNIDPETNAYMLNKFRKHRRTRKYEPPTPEGSVAAPGYFGGAPWSGGSFDPRTRTLYFNYNNEPAIIEMNKDGTGGFSYEWFRDQSGYPGVRPPWGVLTAVNLDTGEYKWAKSLGFFPALKAKGLPDTGTPNLGGSLVTAGGLVFIAATKDSLFRAFDSDTGRELWHHPLPAPGHAAPCTYRIGGKQYVVIAAGGGKFYGKETGDSFVAFALP